MAGKLVYDRLKGFIPMEEKTKGLAALPQVQSEDKNKSGILDNMLSFFSPLGLSLNIGEKEKITPKGGSSLEEKLAETIKRYEGKPILKAKIPVKNDPFTIGFGRTQGVKSGDIITIAQAEKYLKEDIKKRMPEIRRSYPNFDSYPLPLQLQIGQSYYRGTLTPEHSPLTRKLINQGKFEEAAAEFLKHNEYKKAKEMKRFGIRDRMEDVAAELRRTKTSATGGRIASNPNPYEPRVI